MTSKITLKVLMPSLLCLFAGYLLIGLSGYGPVGKEAYELASAVYSSCNRQDVDRLNKLDELIGSAQSASQISVDEAEMLRGIVAIAERGDWTRATIEARELMQDQVSYP